MNCKDSNSVEGGGGGLYCLKNKTVKMDNCVERNYLSFRSWSKLYSSQESNQV